VRNSVYGHIPRCRATNRRALITYNSSSPPRGTPGGCSRPLKLFSHGRAGQSKYAKFQELELKWLPKFKLLELGAHNQ
jgi:hypothetical protein